MGLGCSWLRQELVQILANSVAVLTAFVVFVVCIVLFLQILVLLKACLVWWYCSYCTG